MILIKNRQRKIKINESKLKKDAQKILNYLGYSDFDLGILITTNPTTRKYNREYRSKDKPTDILSFPFYPDLKPDQKIKPKTEDGKNLGDLIISAERIQKDAKELGVSLTKRMEKLIVHGICHLLGFEHDKEKDTDLMEKKEKELMKALS